MIFGLNPFEAVLVSLLGYVPLGVLIYLVWLLARFLRLSIAEMEERQRVRADRQQEIVEVRQVLSVTLRARREACGMTQELVAQKLGVSRQAVSKWETGASDPSTANLVALAELYGVDPTDLVKGIASSRRGDAEATET